MVSLGEGLTQVLIPLAALIGIRFAVIQWFMVSKVKISSELTENGTHNELNQSEEDEEEEIGVDSDQLVSKCAEIQSEISVGAKSFLYIQYKYLAIFTAVFAAIIFLFLGSVKRFSTKSEPCSYKGGMCKPALANALFATIAFLLGTLTSILSGFLGMKIGTYANARTILEARKGAASAFIIAFRSGAVMGFFLAANGLLVLFLTINLFRLYYKDDWEGLFQSITGYALGASSMALFGRVGGGIYTTVTNAAADLVRNLEIVNVPHDDPRNPVAIANNVGDNVVGMGSNLFASYAESSCAALFVASISSFGTLHDFSAMAYPLLISSMGILVCIISTTLTIDFFQALPKDDIVLALKLQLKVQLLVYTLLMTGGIAIVTFTALPSQFTLSKFGENKHVKNWHIFLCVSIGLWASLVIGYTIEYYTSNAYSPVQDVADSCRTSAATNVIFGVALGYKSVIIPAFAISVTIYVSFSLAGVYGIAMAALGMLSTISAAMDAYGPISRNAAGIAEMAGMSRTIKETISALDVAGKNTTAVVKGFAIASGALVSLALLGAFVSRAKIETVDVLTPKVFIGLLLGAMFPYWFSAMIMKSVVSPTLELVQEVHRQIQTIPGLMEGTTKPDYAKCVEIATYASFKGMTLPGALVIITPLVAGTFFGVESLAGVLAGSLVSGVQIAMCASNTGGIWDNAKKYIEVGGSDHARSLGPKGSEAHKAAVIGETVGDHLSGPSLDILIKLMAAESLVFAPFFATHGGLLFKWF